MKAITVYQPWASLAAIGAKGYETRSWATKYRGAIAIHAGISLNHLRGELSNRFISAVQHALFEGSMHVDMWSNIAQLLPRGAVIAIGELAECWEIQRTWPGSCGEGRIIEIGGNGLMNQRIHGADNEFLFGDWTPGRYAWELRNVTPLGEPMPARGHQRLWNWEGKYEGSNRYH